MKRILILSVLTLGLILFFQNCGNIKLAEIPVEVVATKSFPLPKGQFCADPSQVTQIPFKINFVIDMSLSNLGNGARYRIEDTDDFFYQLGMYRPSPEERAKATDPDGRRFDVGTAILNACPEAVNASSNIKFGLVGYSTNIHGGGLAACEEPYRDLAQVSSALTALKAEQDAEKAKGETFEGFEHAIRQIPWPFKMGLTNYERALQCTDDKMAADYTTNLGRQNYMTFFMSDGAPTADPCLEAIDAGGGIFGGSYPNSHLYMCRQEHGIVGCYDPNGDRTATTDECLNVSLSLNTQMPRYVQEQADMLTMAGHGYTFHSIFYTNPAYSGTPDALRAQEVLRNMSQKTYDGRLYNVTDTSQISSLAQEICSAIRQGQQSSFEVRGFLALNLTAKMVAGRLKADTDMDGITDEQENSFGLNPLKIRSPQSKGFHDKLCLLFPTQCAADCTREADPTNPLEFKACEKDLLRSVSGSLEYNTDFDGDGVPNEIELVKDLNIFASDSALDDDADGLSNLVEISQGLDPKKNNNQFPTQMADQMIFQFSPSAEENSCGETQRQYNFGFSNLPLLAVPATNEPGILSHSVNENVFIVLMNTGEINSSQVTTKYKIFKMNTSGTSSDLEISHESFSLWGDQW